MKRTFVNLTYQNGTGWAVLFLSRMQNILSLERLLFFSHGCAHGQGSAATKISKAYSESCHAAGALHFQRTSMQAPVSGSYMCQRVRVGCSPLLCSEKILRKAHSAGEEGHLGIPLGQLHRMRAQARLQTPPRHLSLVRPPEQDAAICHFGRHTVDCCTVLGQDVLVFREAVRLSCASRGLKPPLLASLGQGNWHADYNILKQTQTLFGSRCTCFVPMICEHMCTGIARTEAA